MSEIMKPVVKLRVVPEPPLPASRRELAELVATVALVLGLEEQAFELLVTGDAEIARLNSAYLGCTGPTNVLSFPDEEGDRLGELAISADAVVREATLYGQDPLEHFARLMAHGLLHLAGMDHGEEMYAMTEAAVDAGAEARAG
jgi:probable rRNA maturation factor